MRVVKLDQLIDDTDGMPAEQRVRWILYASKLPGFHPSSILSPKAQRFCRDYAPWVAALTRIEHGHG